MNVVEPAGRVGVGPDLDSHTKLPRLTAIPPVEVEPMWIGVELYGNAERQGFLEDCLDVDGVRFSREQQSTRRMREDGEMRVVERGQHTLRHRVSIHAES